MNFAPLKTKILATLWQLLGKGVTAAVSFVVAVFIGKFLGEVQYGDFAKAFALVETFYVFSDFGLNAVFVKVAIDTKKEGYFLQKLILLRAAGSIFLVAIIFLITFFLPYDPISQVGFSDNVKIGIILASATIFTYSAILTAQAGFQLRLAFEKQFIAQTFGSFTKIILVILAVLIKPSILAVIVAVLAGEIILATSALFLAFPKIFWLRLTFAFENLTLFLAKAAPIGLSLIFNLFYFRGDMIILSLFRQSGEVGNYSLAYKFFEVSLVLPIFFVNSVYPDMVKGFAKGPEVLKKLVSQYSLLLLVASLMVTLGLFFAGPVLIEVIFKKSFGLSTGLLRILALGLPFFYLSAIYMWGIITTGHQKILLPIYGLGAVFNLLFNLVFIPVAGAQASAIITVISEGAILLVLYFSYLRVLRRQ